MADVYNPNNNLGALGHDQIMEDSPLDAGDLPMQDLYNFWHGYALAQRAVTVPVDAIMAAGVTFSPVDAPAGLADEVESYLQERFFVPRFREALIEARVYGGAALIVSTGEDVEELAEPLDEENIETIEAFTVADRYELRPYQYDTRIASPFMKRPLLYSYFPFLPGPGATYGDVDEADEERHARAAKIHASRIIGPLIGTYVPHRLAWDLSRGFGDSVLRAIRRSLLNVAKVHRGVAQAALNVAETVIKDPTLWAKIDGMSDAEILAYQTSTKLASSFNNERWLPPDATLERVAFPMSGMGELVKHTLEALAADVGIPGEKLFGYAPPGGLDGSGDYIRKNYFENLQSQRDYYILPHWRRAYELALLAKDGPGAKHSVKPARRPAQAEGEK
jgi:hypothetical protein